MGCIFLSRRFSIKDKLMRNRSQPKRGDRSAAAFTEGSLSRHLLHLTGFMVMGFLAMNIARLAAAYWNHVSVGNSIERS